MIEIPTEEYLQRLKDLLPGFNYIKAKGITTKNEEKISFDNDSILGASFLLDELSSECYNRFSGMPETDLVLELKDAFVNINCLSVFLSFVYERIINKE